MTRLLELLGKNIVTLLSSQPALGWQYSREENTDDAKGLKIWYEFTDHGLEVICDEGDNIQTIFVHRGIAESLSEMPFSLSRQEVRGRLGEPSKSQPDSLRIRTLGAYGPWDRFDRPKGSIHVQYRPDTDEIDMITVIRADAVPG